MTEMSALFRMIGLGVYVITVSDGKRENAFTAAFVTQASYRPPLLLLAINPQHASYDILQIGKIWTISVLEQGQIDLARHFGTRSAREMDKMQDARWGTAKSGLRYLRDALAYFDCHFVAEYAAGDHQLMLGRVTDGAILNPNACSNPLRYAETNNLDQSSDLYPPSFA